MKTIYLSLGFDKQLVENLFNGGQRLLIQEYVIGILDTETYKFDLKVDSKDLSIFGESHGNYDKIFEDDCGCKFTWEELKSLMHYWADWFDGVYL